MDEKTVLTLIGQVGIGGILIWYLYYTVTIAQPRLMAEYRADLKDERLQRNGLYRTLRDLVEELRQRPCVHGQLVADNGESDDKAA